MANAETNGHGPAAPFLNAPHLRLRVGLPKPSETGQPPISVSGERTHSRVLRHSGPHGVFGTMSRPAPPDTARATAVLK